MSCTVFAIVYLQLSNHNSRLFYASGCDVRLAFCAERTDVNKEVSPCHRLCWWQVWWGATLGIVLALSRAFVQDSTAAFQPELAMMEVRPGNPVGCSLFDGLGLGLVLGFKVRVRVRV